MGARDFAGNQRFKVLTRLGRGGMGTVYQVIDSQRQCRLALKAVGQVRGDDLLRFKREFRALQELNHPNIIELGELLEQEGEWFFTMELITGSEFLPYVRPNDDTGNHKFGLPEEPLPHAVTSPSLPPANDVPLKPGSRLIDHPLALANVGFDEARLRRGLGQLAEALYVLHRHGHVHRDIKPSNVLVTQDGRVVVIDFGLVTGPRASALTTEMQVVGTVAYMSPEQASGQTVGPECDWYALGVMLYECLTGRLPIDGSGLSVMMRKQTEVPPRPRELVPGVPEDLDALCMELLQIDPAQRPKARVILERLHVDVSRLKRVSTTISIGERPDEFVGRDEELALLDGEFEHVKAGEQRIVTLLGDSGLGKSALLRQFAQRVESQDKYALVLQGRCYEQETVPYKALDSLMDQLSRWLKRLDAERSEQILPEDVGLLEHTFPVLQRVPAIARARKSRTVIKDPQERRLLVMRTLRALFAGLAQHVPLVVIIDDFQWSDQDSQRMLAQLTGPPNPLPLLLVFATRPGAADSIVQQGTCVKLGPLTHEQSLELALRMGRQLGRSAPEQMEEVARHADGSPFLIEALLHQLGDTAQESTQDVGELIGRSLGALDEAARRLVLVVCLAGFPITQQVAAEASALEPAELTQRLRALRLSRMVRTSGPLNTDTVEPYHNRIREGVVQTLVDAQREQVHQAIARALETHHAEPQRIAYHMRSGGEPKRAANYLVAAADRATETLAFDRAATFYSEALSIGQLSPEDRRDLSIAKGKALSSAGRGKEAAAAFAEALPGASASETLELRRRIAEQLLYAGYYREGLGACNAFVERLGIHFPTGARRVFLDLILTDLWLWLRGLGSRVRERDQLAPLEVSRVDAYWAMAKGLASYDPIRAQLFHSRGLLTALKAGEPYRLSRAIALSALSAVALSPRGRKTADTRMSAARRLAERTTHPHAIAFISLMQGMIEYLGHCRWRRAAERLAPAEANMRTTCEDVAWELDLASTSRRMCRFWQGDWKELVAEVPDWAKEADARGDRYASVQARSQWLSFSAALKLDFVAAHREIDEVIDLTSPQTSPLEVVLGLLAHLRVDLCEGASHTALQRIDNYRPRLPERLALSSTIMGTLYDVTIVNVVLSAASRAQGKRAQKLYARAQRAARAMVRKGVECTAPFSAVAQAAVRAGQMDTEGALRLLADAEHGFETEGMLAHVSAVHIRRGQLLGGDTGRELVTRGEAWLAQQGVRDVTSIMHLLAAGFPSQR